MGLLARIFTWPAKIYDVVTEWWINTVDDIQGWWDDHVTTSVLVLSAIVLVLYLALIYTALKVHRLQRMLADRPASDADQGRMASEIPRKKKRTAIMRAVNPGKRSWWSFGIFPPPRVDQVLAGMQQQTMGRNIKEPIDEPATEPKLDTRAIKEAFKPTTMRREEFEV